MGKFNETTVSRSQLSETRARRALVICMSVLFLGMTQVCVAAEHAVTIYFGGTGLVKEGYLGVNTRWDTPSLLASLHYNQETDTNHHKIFVPGVGARETTMGDPPNHCAGNPKILFPVDLISSAFQQQRDGHKPICRNWKWTVNEAVQGLVAIVNGPHVQAGDTLIVNVIGHSRGAIAAMWFLDQAFKDGMILDDWSNSGTLTAVNLVVLEPVPGIGLLSNNYSSIEEYDIGNVWGDDPLGHEPMGWDIFRVDKRLENVVAIYAEDERSNRFGAVVPYIPGGVEKLMFRVRGSHQTMAGGLWVGGHAPQSFPIICPYPYTGALCKGAVHNPGLIAVHNVAAITIVELLRGDGWGGVQFTNENHFMTNIYVSDSWAGDEDQRKALFGTQVTNMLNSALNTHYKRMQTSAFFPGPIPPFGLVYTDLSDVPPIPLEEFRGGGCQRLAWAYEGLFKTWSLTSNYSRCMERVMPESFSAVHVKQGLDKMYDVPALGSPALPHPTAWNKIKAMSPVDTDYDDDGHDDDVDNCPTIANADQADSDGDNIGDACELVAEANGNYAVECTTPGLTDVQLSGAGSRATPDGDPLTYYWFIDKDLMAEGLAADGFDNPVIPLAVAVTDYDVDLLVEDGGGYFARDTTTITVEDSAPPVIDCPDNVVVECTGPEGATASFANATAMDACSAFIPPFCAPGSGSTFPVGETVSVCSTYDFSPRVNQSQCHFSVTVTDDELPVIAGLPQPLVVYLDSVLLHKTLGAADFVSAVSDNCAALTLDDLQIISVTPASPLQVAPGKSMPLGAEINPDGKSVTLGEGTFSIEMQVTDAAGNTTTRAFDVRVLSPIPIPAISGFAIIILAIGLALLGFWGLRRRRVT